MAYDPFSMKAADPFANLPKVGGSGVRSMRKMPGLRAKNPNLRPGFISPMSYEFNGGENRVTSLMDQLGAGLRSDITTEQGMADRQFARNNQQIDALGQIMGEGDKQLQAATDATTGLLEEDADRATALGDAAVSGFNEYADDVMGRTNADVDSIMGDADKTAGRARSAADTIGKNIDRDVGGAIKDAKGYAKAAVAAAKEAVTGFNAQAQGAVRAVAQGLERRLDAQLAQISGGLNQDGSVMSPAEQMEARMRLGDQTNMQVAEVAGAMAEKANEFAAQLRMNLAQVDLGAGNIALGAGALAAEGEKTRLGAESMAAEVGLQAGQQKLGAAGLRAQVGTELGQQRLAAESIRQGYTQIRANVNGMIASITNAAAFRSLDWKMQGRLAIAQLVKENPETHVAIFSGLAAMAQLAVAPGGRNQAGFNFG